MKITIEPSNPNDKDAEHYCAVTVDTRGNDELTREAVTAALDAVRVYGHAPNNIADAAEAWAAMNRNPKPDVP